MLHEISDSASILMPNLSIRDSPDLRPHFLQKARARECNGLHNHETITELR